MVKIWVILAEIRENAVNGNGLRFAGITGMNAEERHSIAGKRGKRQT